MLLLAAQVYSTATYGQGTPPCSLVLTSAAGGSASIVDAAGSTVFTTAGTAVAFQSSVPQGGTLASGARLYSPNAFYFLTVQGDGNTVLYSTSLCALLESRVTRPGCDSYSSQKEKELRNDEVRVQPSV